jgi:Sel1 repeat
MANSREDILLLEAKAQDGDLSAKHALGVAYRRGDGVAVDKAKGAGLIIEAADGGLKEALSSMGVCYYYGDGVPKNHRLAMKWFLSAASAGVASGFFNVADLFDDSDQIPKNPVESLAWFTCCLGVMPEAGERMTAIVGDLSDENLDRAAVRADQIMKAAQSGEPLDMIGAFAAATPIPGSVRGGESSKASLLSYLLFFNLRNDTPFSDGLLRREVLKGDSIVYLAAGGTVEKEVIDRLAGVKSNAMELACVIKDDQGDLILYVFDDARHIEAKFGRHMSYEVKCSGLTEIIENLGARHLAINVGLPNRYCCMIENSQTAKQTKPSRAEPKPAPKLKTDWDYIDSVDPKGYYAYFGVKPDADISTITDAYCTVLKECAGNDFVINEANTAYAVLSNPGKRLFYDTEQAGISRRGEEHRKQMAAYNSAQSSGRWTGKVNDSEPSQVRQTSSSGGGCMLLLIPLFTGALWLLS